MLKMKVKKNVKYASTSSLGGKSFLQQLQFMGYFIFEKNGVFIIQWVEQVTFIKGFWETYEWSRYKNNKGTWGNKNYFKR